jgi:hypothetical protein
LPGRAALLGSMLIHEPLELLAIPGVAEIFHEFRGFALGGDELLAFFFQPREFSCAPFTRRDAAATALVNLLSLTAPHADAPADIGQPAVSGFTCDDDRGTDRTSKSASGLTSTDSGTNHRQPSGRGYGRDGHEWTRDSDPVGSTLGLPRDRTTEGAEERERPRPRTDSQGISSRTHERRREVLQQKDRDAYAPDPGGRSQGVVSLCAAQKVYRSC